MAKITKYQDEVNLENFLEIYVNNDNRLFIEAGHIDDDPVYATGWATLSIEDVELLITDLKILLDEMKSNV